MSKCFLLAPTGILVLKYFPLSPLFSHVMHTNRHKLFLLGVFLCPSPTFLLLLHGLFSYFLLAQLCMSLSLSLSFSFSFSLSPLMYLYLYLILSSSLHLSAVSLSLFCIHVLGCRQKPAVLECMCSRSGTDCAAAEMSFQSDCILPWSDDTLTNQNHNSLFLFPHLGKPEVTKNFSFMQF